MFKGMYDLMNKFKQNPLNPKVALQQNATPILSSEELLSSEKRQQILSDICTLMSLPDDEYDKIFSPVIHNFASFVQNLPETERSFYASLGGLLDHALERASLSLFLARTYLLPEGSTLASVSEEEMLWVYAIFTASLLLDIGKIPTRHVVSISDAQGNVSEAWHPFMGPMKITDKSTHYLFGFMDEHNDHLRWLVTPLLARQMIPDEGFRWLSGNPEVLQAWLGLLTDDQREMGWLKVIPLADAQIIEGYFTDRKVFRHSLSAQTIALIHKILKERKDAQKRQKEFSERISVEQSDKAHQSKFHSDETKASKQSLFGGFASITQQEKLHAAAQDVLANAKDNVGKFLSWLHQAQEKSKTGEAKVEIPRTAEGAVITQAVIDKFISENKGLGITSQQIQASLIQSALAISVAAVQQTGLITPALLVTNPYVIFPASLGVPPIGMGVQVFPPQVIPEVQAAPTQAPTEAPKAQQQAQQTFKPFLHGGG